MLRKQAEEAKVDTKELELNLLRVQKNIQELENKIIEVEQKISDSQIDKEKAIKAEQDLRIKQLKTEKSTPMFLAKVSDWFHKPFPPILVPRFQANIEALQRGRKESMAREKNLEEIYSKMILLQNLMLSCFKKQLAELKQSENQLNATRLLNIFDSALSKSAATNRFTHFKSGTFMHPSLNPPIQNNPKFSR